MKREWWIGAGLVLLASTPLWAQSVASVVTAQPSPPITPSAGANEFQGGIVWAFLSAAGLEWVKRHPSIAILSRESAFWLQRLAGFALAAVAALGVHWAFDASAGSLTITGLTSTGLWAASGETIRQWASQEVMYRVAVKNYGN